MRENFSQGIRRKSRGFVLITAALAMVMLIGILGLVQDLARMYVVRNELQAFADAASIAAALQLNGASEGIQHATSVATSYPDQWNFRTATPENITVTFATTAAGPYTSNPATAAGVQYVQVTAQGTLPLYFMPGFSDTAPLSMMLFSISRNQTMSAMATSGQVPVNQFYENLIPFSPDAINVTDPNFGYTVGQMYTLRWPPPGQRGAKGSTWCSGDAAANYVTPDPAQERGFIDIGWGGVSSGSAYIRQAIVSSVQSHPLAIGDAIVNVNGNKGTESTAMLERFSQDTDTQSTNYAQYLANRNDPNSSNPGNGRRLVIVPVNNPNIQPNPVLGFALLLLHSDVCQPSAVASCCGEYVGSALVPGSQAGGPGAGAYKVQLLQ